MRTASRAAWSGQPWGQVAALPPLDQPSQQLERDADATMTEERAEYAGQYLAKPGPAEPGAAADVPQ
jgi:hypothetical protein